MNNELWGRKCKIYIRGDGNSSYDCEIDVSNLKCVFSVESDLRNISTCSLDVYNVNYETENFIVKNGYELIIEAGYGDETTSERYGKIFKGTIIQSLTTIEEENFKISILALKGNEDIEQNFIKLSCSSATTREQLKLMGENATTPLSMIIPEDIGNNETPRGKVFFNSAVKYLQDFIKRMGETYYTIEDDTEKQGTKIKIFDMKNTQTLAVEISPETGLIGVPQVGDEGIIIRTLLDPRLKPWLQVKLKDSIIQRNLIAPNDGSYYKQNAFISQTGNYKILSIKHQGDTYGDIWITELTARGENSQMIIDNNGVAVV